MHHSPGNLELLVLAGGPRTPQIDALLALVARRITAVADAGALMQRVWEQFPDLIIVEQTRQAQDVPTLCRQVRQFFQTPIMVLEEGAGEGERISWLDSGADEVLSLGATAPAELVARCHALLRRMQRQLRRDPASLRLQALGLQLDIAGRRLYPARGRPVDLSANGTRLLALFLSQGEALVSTAIVEQHLFGTANLAGGERVASLVKQLNRQMAALPGPTPRIERVRGTGYRLSPPQ